MFAVITLLALLIVITLLVLSSVSGSALQRKKSTPASRSIKLMFSYPGNLCRIRAIIPHSPYKTVRTRYVSSNNNILQNWKLPRHFHEQIVPHFVGTGTTEQQGCQPRTLTSITKKITNPNI